MIETPAPIVIDLTTPDQVVLDVAVPSATVIELTAPEQQVLAIEPPTPTVIELTTARDGKSAYQSWLDLGNVGTEADFIASLHGQDGQDGTDGNDGTDGRDGTDGTDGTDGKSAYQIWLDQGNTGTEADFLVSLKGDPGIDGNDGTDGQDGRGIVSITQPSGPTTAQVNYTSGGPDTLNLPTGPAGNNGTNGNDGRGITNAAISGTDLVLSFDRGVATVNVGRVVGFNGNNGTNGLDGKTVRSGSGVPSAGLGVDGDFYINVAAWTIYGPKASGAWGSPTSIIGPAGTNDLNNPNVSNKMDQFEVLNTQEWTVSAGGGANAPDIITPSDTQETGCLRFRASTADTATSTIVRANSAVVSVNGDVLLTAKFRIPILPDATDDFIHVFGLFSGSTPGGGGSNAALWQNQIAMRLVRSGGNVVWQGLCRNANVQTSFTDTTALAANTTYCIQINKTSTGVAFYLNSVLIGIINTNVPTSYLIPISRLVKVAGTTLRSIEQYCFQQRYTRTSTISYAQL